MSVNCLLKFIHKKQLSIKSNQSKIKRYVFKYTCQSGEN